MEKKSFLRILLYVSIAVVIVVASFLASQWYLGRLSVSIEFPGPSPRSGTTRLVQSSTGGGVVRYEGSRGNIYYQVKGIFSSGLRTEGQSVVGQFIIDGDANKTPVTVAIDTQKGFVNLQIFPQSFEEEADVLEVPTQDVLTKITSGTQALLLIVQTENTGPGPLDKLTNDSWDSLQGLTLRPATVGIIEKK